jgi:glutamate synthase domain-containing protein 2
MANGERSFEMLKIHILVIAGTWAFTILTLVVTALVAHTLKPFEYLLPALLVAHLVSMGVFEIWCRWIQDEHEIYNVFGQSATYREWMEFKGPKDLDYNGQPDARDRTSRLDQEWVQSVAHGGKALESHGARLHLDRDGVIELHTLSVPEEGCQHTEAIDQSMSVINMGRGDLSLSRKLLGVSGMSWGSLTDGAVEAISVGAQAAGCFVNIGEGGLASYHLAGGSKCLIEFQIGTGMYGCRNEHARFDATRLNLLITGNRQIRSIQIKLSQGAKAGHGGKLPGAKVTEEVARVRGIPAGQDCNSPGIHSAFKGARGLAEFIADLRTGTGRIISIKMAIGSIEEFDRLCQVFANNPSGIPDTIQIDGGEGGSGAAPLELMGQAARSLIDALQIADLLLRKYGLRERVTLIASGKIFRPDQVIRAMALGADAIQLARGVKYAMGCVAAGACHKGGECPAGITSNGKDFNVEFRGQYLENYLNALHRRTAELLAPLGVRDYREIVGSRVRYMDIKGIKIWQMSDIKAAIKKETTSPINDLMNH